jgi:hypothetical protein
MLKTEYESGTVFNLSSCAVYGAGSVDEDEAQQAADPQRPVPDDCVRLESDRDDLRSGVERAELLAVLHERTDDFEYRHDDVNADDARIPVHVVAAGKPACATYLAVQGLDNDEIGSLLDIGSRTVSQYVADFRQGTR